MFLQFTEVSQTRSSEYLYSDAKEHYASITGVTLDNATTIFTVADGRSYAVPFTMPALAIQLFKALSTGMRLGPDHMVLRTPCYLYSTGKDRAYQAGGKALRVMAAIASATNPMTDNENVGGTHAATEAHVENGHEPYVR